MANLTQISKEIHKPVNRKFQRRKVIASEVNEIWGADLADMQQWKDFNDDNKYILTIIDVFSKFAWAVPLKDKTGPTVSKAFQQIFKNVKPKKLWTDQGGEFYNKAFKDLLKKENIEIYSTFGEHKSAVVERFNRTLKDKMYRNFTTKSNRIWVKDLDKLLDSYNNTKHRTIKMTPTEAIKKNNYDELNHNFITSGKEIKAIQPKLKVGDYVRISRLKGTFEKGYDANWSIEIFLVSEVLPTRPITYHLVEYNNDPIEGSFYEQELQFTNESDVFLVETVLKKRTVKGQKQIFVKWLGWPEKYNQWIDETNEVPLK